MQIEFPSGSATIVIRQTGLSNGSITNFTLLGAKLAHRGIEILDLESNRRPIARRFPFFLRHVAECESRGAQVVLYPVPVCQ